MCGIAGIFSTQTDLNLNSEPARKRLIAMQSALVHRGPDSQGDYFSPAGNAALCHTRLSIIDLSSAGHQPMLSADSRYVITFNGEIYNYQTLRQELEQTGETFISNSDTEVLLKLYARDGADCVAQLRGMFAFVIWDEVEQCGFAARDALGIKPLYYLQTDNGDLAFASELRSLLCAELHEANLSQSGLASYFLSGTISEPDTLLADINMLPAGHTLTWQLGRTRLKRYWALSFPATKTHPDKAVSMTRSALESTVKAHFVSDVPVGIFLSGGIDSSVLVALARQVTDTTLNTYSIAFESPQWNEGELAKRVAQHFGTNHTEFLMTPELAKPLFKEFLAAVDQPTIDGFNTFCVSKLASQAGEKVVLSGLGGDEIFAGYKSFYMLPKMLKLSKRLAWLAPAFRFLGEHLEKSIPVKLHRSLDFLSQPNSLLAAHLSLRGIFSRRETNALCQQFVTISGINKTDNTHPSPDTSTYASELPNNVADAISQLELSTYMRNQLLRDSDVMSMACGLELRVPFVDKELIDTISAIPADIRLQQGKQLLIDAVPELPEWVFNRPKQGFRFPFDEWFSDQWKDIPAIKDTPSWIKLTPWYRRWSLLVLNDWLSRYLNTGLTDNEIT